MQNKFSFRASLKKSWSVFKTNWVLLVGGLVGYYIISLAFSWISESVGQGFTGMIISLIGMVLMLMILIGYYMTGSQLLENKPTSFSGLIKVPNKLLGTTIVVSIIINLLMALIIVIGMVGFIVFDTPNNNSWFLFGEPSIFSLVSVLIALLIIAYIKIRTGFLILFSIDYYTSMKSWGIIKYAWQSTKGKEWLIVKFVIKLVLLNLLGVLALVIGLLVTVPLSILITIDFYRTHINPKSGTTHTEPVHTDMVVKSPEIESPESETETVSEISMSESSEMNSETIAENAETISETGDSETTTA